MNTSQQPNNVATAPRKGFRVDAMAIHFQKLAEFWERRSLELQSELLNANETVSMLSDQVEKLKNPPKATTPPDSQV